MPHYDAERWIGWVAIAWIVAFATCAISIWLVLELGTIKVPRLSPYSSFSTGTDTVINWTIWGWAIGQSIAALMLAALFSIANGAYRNSCQTLTLLTKLQAALPEPKMESPESIDPASGIRVKRVRDTSPLKGVLHPGCRLLRVNGHEPDSEEDAVRHLVKGKNTLAYLDLAGKVVVGTLRMTPGPLHIEFAELQQQNTAQK